MNPFSSVARATLLGSAVLLSSGIAQAQSLAGPKPPSVQTGRDAGCIGELSLDGSPGPARVADGTRTQTTWSIQSIYETPAVCSFPSARPVDVNCRRNGVDVDPLYCQESQFKALLSQGYRTIGNSTNWSTAKWVLPGETDAGCIAEWRSVDGATPQGCGDVNVPVVSTCVVTNVQSGTPDDPNKYCSAASKPSDVKVVKDYRSCGFAIQTGQWGAYSNTCGPVTHDRPLTCVRGDGAVMAMSDSNCQTALSAFCSSSSHRCVSVNNVIVDRENVQLQSCGDTSDAEYFWQPGGWVSNGTTCGTDTQTRSVTCVSRATGGIVSDDLCVGMERPPSTQDVVVDISCGKTSVCTGQTPVANWADASSFGSYAAACRSAGGDCVEQTTDRTIDGGGQPQTSYQSVCYSGGGNTPVGAIGPGDGPFAVHGANVTNGTEGYCDYSAGAAGARKCVKGAYPAAGCSSGVPSVTLSMPGKVRSGRGFVSATTGFGNADGSNGVEGQECRATSTITNNGETKTLVALGTFNSSNCMGSTSDTIGGTMYNVEVDVQVTPTGIGYDLNGSATANGVGCGTVSTPTPTPTPTSTTPTPTGACYAAWGYIGYGPEDVYRDTVEITEDKIWTTGDPTWYVWAPGTYSTYDAFSLSRKNKSSSPALAFAVPAGAHLEIYSGANLTGTKLMDVVGPKIIQKSGQTGRFTSSWLTDDWSSMPLMRQYAPATRSDEAIASKPLLASYGGSFKVSCGPAPTPTPTPTPTSTQDDLSCVASGSEAANAAAEYQSCVNGTYGSGEAPLAYTLRNVDGSYTFCQSNELVETQACGSNTIMWTGQGVCRGSHAACVGSPTPTPTPVDPTPTPTPIEPTPTPTSMTVTNVQAGYCRYTSSGGGRHACGEWGQGLTYNNVQVPGPKNFCSGNLIAGYEASYIEGQSTSPPDPLGTDWSDRSSYHWGTPPKIRDVAGAKCVFSWKTGYSGEWKNDQPFWVSAYYDGPPTGTQGQTWIKK